MGEHATLRRSSSVSIPNASHRSCRSWASKLAFTEWWAEAGCPIGLLATAFSCLGSLVPPIGQWAVPACVASSGNAAHSCSRAFAGYKCPEVQTKCCRCKIPGEDKGCLFEGYLGTSCEDWCEELSGETSNGVVEGNYRYPSARGKSASCADAQDYSLDFRGVRQCSPAYPVKCCRCKTETVDCLEEGFRGLACDTTCNMHGVSGGQSDENDYSFYNYCDKQKSDKPLWGEPPMCDELKITNLTAGR